MLTIFKENPLKPISLIHSLFINNKFDDDIFSSIILFISQYHSFTSFDNILVDILKSTKSLTIKENNIIFQSLVMHNLNNSASYLLKYKGVDPSLNNNFALLTACANGNTTLVELLLSHNLMFPAIFNFNPLKVAYLNHRNDICHLLYQREDIKSLLAQMPLEEQNKALNAISIHNTQLNVSGF